MSFDKLLLNLLKYKLIYGGVGVEVLGISAGIFFGLGTTWYFVASGIVIIILYIICSTKNKIAVNKDTLLVESYKTQTKTLLGTLNRLFESAEEQDLARSFYDKLVQDSIIPILEELDFMHNPGMRVSLYSHSGRGFTLLYRHSDDPEFRKKGRAVYPENEGVIGDAYHKNRGHVDNLPDPDVSEDEWAKAQMDPRFGKMKDEAVVRNLTMKSRNLFALPIRSGYDKHMIIVFESVKEKQLNTNLIEKLINNHHGLRLKEILTMYRNIEPSLEYANKMKV